MSVREPTGHEPGAVQRGLQLLEAVATLGPGATARQLAAHTRIPRATAYRLLNLLVADGYLVRIADLSGFALGIRTQHLARPRDLHPGDRNAEVLADVRRSVRCGVFLAAYVENTVDFIDSDPDHDPLGADMMTQNPHACAVGKVMMARSDLLGDVVLRRLTPHTITDQQTLREHLRRVRSAELATEADEAQLGRSALAIPVRSSSGHIAGALVVVGRTGRLRIGDAALIDMLRDRARELRVEEDISSVPGVHLTARRSAP